MGDNIVGMDFHLEQLKSMMKTERDDVYMVSIYGIGGIGKTTMAMAIIMISHLNLMVVVFSELE